MERAWWHCDRLKNLLARLWQTGRNEGMKKRAHSAFIFKLTMSIRSMVNFLLLLLRQRKFEYFIIAEHANFKKSWSILKIGGIKFHCTISIKKEEVVGKWDFHMGFSLCVAHGTVGDAVKLTKDFFHFAQVLKNGRLNSDGDALWTVLPPNLPLTPGPCTYCLFNILLFFVSLSKTIIINIFFNFYHIKSWFSQVPLVKLLLCPFSFKKIKLYFFLTYFVSSRVTQGVSVQWVV